MSTAPNEPASGAEGRRKKTAHFKGGEKSYSSYFPEEESSSVGLSGGPKGRTLSAKEDCGVSTHRWKERKAEKENGRTDRSVGGERGKKFFLFPPPPLRLLADYSDQDSKINRPASVRRRRRRRWAYFY